MSRITKVIAPTNNVNDTSVTVYELLVEDRSFVKKNQVILTAETSKTTIDITASEDGYIRFCVTVGDEVENGGLLAIITEQQEDLEQIPDSKPAPKEAVVSERKKITADNKARVAFGYFETAVTLGEFMVKSGDEVHKEDCLCTYREKDKVHRLNAPADGYVVWNKLPYMKADAGEMIGYISKVKEFNSYRIPTKKTIAYKSTRISYGAQKLLTDRGLSADELSLTGLVTEKRVQDRITGSSDKSAVERELTEKTYHSCTGEYRKLRKSKQAEAKALSMANRDATISQVTVLVPTKGIFSYAAHNPEISRRLSALFIFETARLLRKYPNLISVYEESQIYEYSSINIGYALSIEEDLKVPVFKNCDRKSLEEILNEKDGYIEKYLMNKFEPGDLEEGVFTISDLSSSGCYIFNPVINLGQSAILGIGGENTQHTDYPLVLAFDHRVSDGAIASEFLCELRDRMVAHEAVLIDEFNLLPKPRICCESCFRTVEELDEKGYYLIKTIGRDGKEHYICSLCTEGLV